MRFPVGCLRSSPSRFKEIVSPNMTRPTLIHSQMPVRADFVSWFSDRLYSIVMILSSAMLVVSTGFEGSTGQLGFSLGTTLLIWSVGFLVYGRLRNWAIAERGQEKYWVPGRSLVGGLWIIVTIGTSLFAQRRLGFSVNELWPLFYIALFASVERVSKHGYFLLVLIIGLSLFAVRVDSPRDLLLPSFYWGHREVLVQWLSLLFFSLIWLFLVSSIHDRNRSTEALLKLSAGGKSRWYEPGHSRRIVRSMIEATEAILGAVSCDLVFVNNQTGVCRKYRHEREEGHVARESYTGGEVFQATGALREAIESGMPAWKIRRQEMPVWKRSLYQWASMILPFGGYEVYRIYLPVRKHDTESKVEAVVRVSVRTAFHRRGFIDPTWQACFGSIAEAFGKMLMYRRITQAFELGEQISKLAVEGRDLGLYGLMADRFAGLFACPVAVWMKTEESSDQLRVVATSQWFLQDSARIAYVDSSRIDLGKGLVGRIIEKAAECPEESEEPELSPIYVRATDAGSSHELAGMGVQQIAVQPLVISRRPIGAVVLYLLTDGKIDGGEERLLEALARHATLSVEHRRVRAFQKDLVDVFREGLLMPEANFDWAREALVLRAAELLGADCVDLHIVDSSTGAIVNSLRAESGQISNLEVSREEEKVLHDMGRKLFPIFAQKATGKGATVLPGGTESFSLLPLTALSRLKGIVVVAYKKKHRFPPEERLLHEAFLSVAEHLASLYEHEKQLRRKLGSEKRESLAARLHDNVNDIILAMKFRAAGGRDALSESVRIDDDKHRYALSQFDTIRDFALVAYERLHKLLDETWTPDEDEIIEKGLLRAIGEYYDSFDFGADLSITPMPLRSESIPLDIQVLFLKIVKEALRNIVQHSSADSVKISCNVEPEGFVLTVADDGRGFDIKAKDFSRSRGIRSIKEMVSESGGKLIVTASRGLGTTIRVEVPAVE